MTNNFVEKDFEALVNFLKKLPQSKVKMLNIPRYKLMLKTAAKLKAFLQKHMDEGEINIEVDKFFNLGSITVELDDLVVENPIEFAELISSADNFEIYPLTNGKIRFSITFQGVLKSVA